MGKKKDRELAIYGVVEQLDGLANTFKAMGNAPVIILGDIAIGLENFEKNYEAAPNAFEKARVVRDYIEKMRGYVRNEME